MAKNLLKPSLEIPPVESSLAIVGGGAAGTLLACHAVRSGMAPVVLYERTHAPGRGVAYSATNPHHTLNVPARMMGGETEAEGEGFVRWLLARGEGPEAAVRESYQPRALFGAYLQERLAILQSEFPGRLDIRRDEVVDIEKRDAGFVLHAAGTGSLTAGRVVLCLGNPDPRPLSPVSDARVVETPWAAEALAVIAPDEAVVIVGSALTAADVTVDLADRGHRGPITLLSRHGIPVLADAPVADYPEFFDPVLAERGIAAVMRRLRAEVKAAAAAGIAWYSVVEAFRVHATAIWLRLSDIERRRFLRHLRTIWLAHRHRVPPTLVAALAGMRERGQLSFLPGRLSEVRSSSVSVALSYRPRGSDQVAVMAADRVINCTGPDWNIARSPSPLLAALQRRGLAAPDPHGLGFAIEGNLQLLGAGGAPIPGLFTVGPPTRGYFWETVAVPHIRRQIERLVESFHR